MSNKLDELTLATWVLAYAFTIGLFGVFSYIDAIIIRDLWKWYVVPSLDLPQLTVKSAFGINLVLIAFRTRPMLEQHVKGLELLKRFGWYWLGMLITWGVGYVVYRWF